MKLIRRHPELSSFPREYTEYAGGGGEGQGLQYAFLIVDALHFHKGVAKINIFKVLFWEVGNEGRGHNKVLCVRF